MGEKLLEILNEAAKKKKNNNNNKSNKNGKMLKKLHGLDDKIEEFIDGLEDEIMSVEDNPMFVKKANQLLADMSKEYSEFIMALRAIVNAVDRKGQILPAFEKQESRVRDVLDGQGNGPAPAEEEPLPPEEEEPAEDEFVIAKKDKKSPVKEALENIELSEGRFKKGYWVTLSGRGGELESEFAKNQRDIKKIIMSWVSTLGDGDIIKVNRGESEY